MLVGIVLEVHLLHNLAFVLGRDGLFAMEIYIWIMAPSMFGK